MFTSYGHIIKPKKSPIFWWFQPDCVALNNDFIIEIDKPIYRREALNKVMQILSLMRILWNLIEWNMIFTE